MESAREPAGPKVSSRGRKLSLPLQLKLGVLNRSGRRKSSIEDQGGKEDHNTTTDVKSVAESETTRLESPFFTLPVELQSDIILYLDIPSILALRQTSRALAGLVSEYARDITRLYIQREIPRSCVKLCSGKTYNLRFLYHLRHAHTACIHLALQLESFIEEEYLRSIHTRKWRQMDRSRFVSRATPLLLHLSYYYNTSRLWMLHYYPMSYSSNGKLRGWIISEDILAQSERSTAGSDGIVDHSDLFCCSKALEECDSDKASFPKHLIRRCFTTSQLLKVDSMQTFLSTAVDRELRPPSYASSFELRLRRWGDRFPSQIRAGLLTLGGLDVARKIFSIKTQSERCAEVERWYKSLQKSESVHWKTNWNTAVYGPFDPASSDLLGAPAVGRQSFDAPEFFQISEFSFWSNHARDILIEDERAEERKTPRFFISHLLGYDILAGTRWAEAIEAGTSFDESSENEDQDFNE